MSNSVDPAWLFGLDTALFNGFGQRMDVGGVPRWSNPDFPTLRDGNHAAVPADAGLIPDQLVQIFDAQEQDGATQKCVDIYGGTDSRDEVVLQMGLQRQNEAPIHVFHFNRDRTPAPLPNVATMERAAPPVWEIQPREWVDAVSQVHGGSLKGWERDVVMAEAALEIASFYAIRIGDNAVAAIARYDFGGASQVSSLYTDTAFRKTGFGQACLARAIHASPHRVIFGLIAGNNSAMLRIAERSGGDLVLKDPRRRYVGTW